MMNRKGMSIIFAVFTLILLSLVAATLFSMVATDIDSAARKVLLFRAFGIAESGLQIGSQAIADDVNAGIQTSTPTNNGYHGLVYLEGYNATGNSGSDWENACFHGRNWRNPAPLPATLNATSGASVEVWGFEQRSNLIGTRIKNVEVVVRVRRAMASGGGRPGASPQIQLEYTTNGADITPTWIALGASFTVKNGGWGPNSYRTRQFSTLIDWDIFMNSPDDFRIRARRTNGGGRRTCEVDWLSLRVTTEVDAQTEDWYTDWMGADGTPIDVNLDLGSGRINTITIDDESGKVNINYVTSQTWRLIYYLIRFDIGITRSAEAQAITDEIIAYLTGGDRFDTVEELRQLPSMTDEIYELIKDDVTVYSWVNSDTTRPGTPGSPEARAPININTASRNVIQAFLRSTISGYPRIANIADDIIAQRSVAPFTHMFSHYAIQAPTRDQRSFAGFIIRRGDLSTQEKRIILEFADASYINRSLTNTWYNREQRATELSFYSNTFLISVVGEAGGVRRTIRSVYGDIYNYNNYSLSANGSFNLPTHIGDISPEAYWREDR